MVNEGRFVVSTFLFVTFVSFGLELEMLDCVGLSRPALKYIVPYVNCLDMDFVDNGGIVVRTGPT